MFSGLFDQAIEHDFGLHLKKTARRQPWQNGVVERVIGTIRRDLTNHVIVLDEAHLLALLRQYQDYYNNFRTYDSLQKDSPLGRTTSSEPIRKPRREKLLSGLHSTYLAG